jgi:hypothetical protein
LTTNPPADSERPRRYIRRSRPYPLHVRRAEAASAAGLGILPEERPRRGPLHQRPVPHLIGHCAFIARFNRAGFFATYFADPSATRRFLDQFDRSKGCRSTEYGDGRWIAGGDYCDVNAAMVDEASARLPVLRRLARGREIERARREIASGEATLARLLAEEEASR